MDWLEITLKLGLMIWIGAKLYSVNRYVRYKKYLMGISPPISWSYYRWIMIVVGLNLALTADLFPLMALLYLGIIVIYNDHLFSRHKPRRSL